MVKKKITSKVISKAPVEEAESTGQQEKEPPKNGKTKRGCLFCQTKTNPSYTDINILRRFITDRAKIVPKIKSSLCSKHQRFTTKQIKYARHLSLLPFTPKV